ncbi:MAG: nucleotidyltransferase family protein [Nocardioides sp.]|nr:nucleotidyltransferase family protein [Nocardioides sp.]
MQPSPRAVQAVRDAVRAALVVEAGGESTWRLDPSVSSEDFQAAVLRHRVVEVLADNAEGLHLTAPLTEWLRTRRQPSSLRAMSLVRELGRIQQVLDGADIRWLAFKGPALAVQTTGDFTARGIGDLDVLVDPSDVAAAVHALEAHGWQLDARFSRPGPSWGWRRLLHSYYECPLVGPDSRIDLHWRLAPGAGVLPEFGHVAARAVQVPIGPFSTPTLAPADALAHSCSHAAKDDYRWLRSLVDIHRFVRAGEPLPDTVPGRRAAAVLAATIGLPGGTAPPAPRVVRRAMGAQERPFLPHAARLPGAGLVDAVRRSSVGSSWRGRRIVLLNVLLPAPGPEVDDVRAVTAIPRAILHRGRKAVRRLQDWRRRA